MDSPDINASHSGSHLLSLESPDFPSNSSHSRTGSGEDDLSLSILNKPFSLLARPQPPVADDAPTPTRPTKEGSVVEGDNGVDEADVRVEKEDDAETVQRTAQERRDEKLKSDLFILKKLNAAFELFYESLEETGSANERVAAQIAETDALLNKYINILSKSEEFSRLIFDERWYGAEEDEEEFKRDEEEKARKAAEEKARRELEEQERLEREKEERRKREDKERVEREKAERAVRGGLRGTRGTRISTATSTRGTASSGRGATNTGMSRGVPKRPTSAAGGSGIPRVSYRPT